MSQDWIVPCDLGVLLSKETLGEFYTTSTYSVPDWPPLPDDNVDDPRIEFRPKAGVREFSPRPQAKFLFLPRDAVAMQE